MKPQLLQKEQKPSQKPRVWAVVGLGNPGKAYEQTRHNVGFAAVDLLASSTSWSNKWKCDFQKTSELLLVKPQAYMNLSGEASAPLLNFYQIEPQNVIVVYDDLDLEPGRLKVALAGSAGGHKGVTNLVKHLKTDKFFRIRLGIGHPRDSEETSRIDVSNWVLSKPGLNHKKLIDDCVGVVPDIVQDLISEGLESSQQRWNRKGLEPKS